MTMPAILALDFDGVICDGMREYFESAWRAYRRLRPTAPTEPPAGLFESFARLRPVVETGWEMPTLLHAVLSGAAEGEILAGWRPDGWLADLGALREAVGAALDDVRDRWIAADETGWLAAHRFYPGVIERLRGLASGPVRVYVITTKEGRFARKLLEGQGLALPPSHVYGKEARRPKRAILLDLANGDGGAGLWFVEDRLKTLQEVKTERALAGAGLFLAAWGYNTAAERAAARDDDRIALLPLDRFPGDFEKWPASSR
jgi:phosphoglycolate phosphatase-like HAD superfamily hydrolase